jgi:thioredoxin reductase
MILPIRPERADSAGMSDERYDVVIIGGGPAGLSAALTLSRARRSVLVVDGGQPRNAPAGHVHNYLGREGTPPAELLAAGRAEVAGYGGTVRPGQAVDAVRDGAELVVTLADGSAVRGRRLLVATGLTDELPDLPGVADRFGRDVLHCPYCHGWEVRDQPLGVLGGGPMGVHQALLLRQWSPDVTLFPHTELEPDPDQARRLAARGVAVVPGAVAGLVVTDDALTGVRLVSGQVVPRRAVLVRPRLTARSAVLASLGLVAEDRQVNGISIGRAVPAEPTGATAVPGVYVAGNVTDPMAVVLASAAAGLTVAAAVNGDLVNQDAADALAQPVGARP